MINVYVTDSLEKYQNKIIQEINQIGHIDMDSTSIYSRDNFDYITPLLITLIINVRNHFTDGCIIIRTHDYSKVRLLKSINNINIIEDF